MELFKCNWRPSMPMSGGSNTWNQLSSPNSNGEEIKNKIFVYRILVIGFGAENLPVTIHNQTLKTLVLHVQALEALVCHVKNPFKCQFQVGILSYTTIISVTNSYKGISSTIIIKMVIWVLDRFFPLNVFSQTYEDFKFIEINSRKGKLEFINIYIWSFLFCFIIWKFENCYDNDGWVG